MAWKWQEGSVSVDPCLAAPNSRVTALVLFSQVVESYTTCIVGS